MYSKDGIAMYKLRSLLLLILCSQSMASHACTTIIVGKKASANGQTMIARTSDTIDARRAKNFQIYYSEQGEKSYIGLPYADLQADPTYDMAQVVTNRYGVSISATETIQSSPKALLLDAPVTSKSGVSEPNIPGIVMPGAKNAKEAIAILGAAIERRGVYSSKGFGVLIADKHSAWYLETLSGHQWVAIEIPQDMYFVAANGPGQIQAWQPERYHYMMSHYQGINPIEFATAHRIAVFSEGAFNFRATYADVNNPDNPKVDYVRLAYLQHYFNPNTTNFDEEAINKGVYPMFLKPEHLISITDLKMLQASHYEEYPSFDPYLYDTKDEEKRAFYYPISNVRTSNAHVTVVYDGADNRDPNIGNIQYIALGMPSVSFYIPIYYGVIQKPGSLIEATNTADNHSLFWEFRKLQALVFLSDPNKGIDFDFKQRIAKVKTQYAMLSQEIEATQKAMEKRYLQTHDSSLLDEFTQNTVAKVSVVNRKMLDELMSDLAINERYHLDNEDARNLWFSELIHTQDCNYRTDHCRSSLLTKTYSSFIDEPIL